MPSRTVRVTVHFAQGDPLKVQADLDDTRLRNLAGNLEKAMAANYVGFELEGTLHLFPLHSVRAVEISPAPTAVMKHVVRDARRSG
jgi:hypothetical protein